jgi:parallel beta-helix repeat protein
MPYFLKYYIILLVATGSVQASSFESNAINAPDHLVINEVLASNIKSNYDKDFGAYSDWIELYNPGDIEMDIGGWYLSDNPGNPDKWEIPASTIIPPNGYLLFWADGRDLIPGQNAFVEFTEIHEIIVSEHHLNFKINSDQEEVFLHNDNLELIDSIVLTDQERNYSYGRNRENPETWSYLGEPTPLAENSNYSSDTFITAEKPLCSIAGGLYQETQMLELSAFPPGIVIKYTTDGSEPGSESNTYNGPLTVNFSQVIKARAFVSGKLPGEVATESYIIGKETDLPVLSVSTSHQNLWGFDFGLYQNNFKNREIFAHLEYFNEDGNKEFKINAGLQLFGSQIFLFDQKPFSIFFRNRYGQDTLNYRLFKNKELSTYHSLVLRNGGNDNNLTMFRDGLGAALVENQMDIDYQSYLPLVLYVNGEYWGIFNLREKLNKDYLETNHQVNPSYIDVIEDSLKVNDGDANSYSDLMNYILLNDLAQDLHYNYVSGKIDINAFINYMSYKIYGGYKQWQVNSKYWKERNQGSMWRWIAFDLEHCFGGPGGENYDSNTFLSALESGNGSTDWYTLLFRKLMGNENFRAKFIQRTALHLNTVFRKGRVLSIIDSLQVHIENEMEDHITRWGSPVSKAAWLQHSNYLKEFASYRNQYMFHHMMDYFNIADTSRLTIKSSKGGKVVVSSSYILKHDSATFTMCNQIPVSLLALPESGYTFSGWNNTDIHEEIQLVFNRDTSLFASFERTNHNIIPDTIQGTVLLTDTQFPWTSIGNIVIPPGDSLIIREGVNIRMTPDASLINYGYLKIEGTKANPVTFDIHSNSSGTYYKSKRNKWGAICIQSPDTTKIFNAILKNASSGLAHKNFKGTISASDSKLHLRGVSIHDVRNPIYCYKSEVVIDSCWLSSNGTGDLINLRGCRDPVIKNNKLKGNFYKDTDAIDLDSVDHAIIEDNLIFSFFGSNSDGIDLGETSKNIVIRNNTILSCSDKGISVGQGSDVEATGNRIVDCMQGFGIKDFNSFARINQNTLYNNYTGVACFEKNPGNGGGSAQLENTIIASSVDKSVFSDEYSSLTVSYCLSDRDILQGYNNLFGDPLFEASSDQNFWLKPGSPCFNSGNPNLHDPDGSRADIGAFILEKGTVKQQILINEINYNAHSSYNTGDWIELYNGGAEQVDLSGWVMKGENPDDEYRFPDNLQLTPGSYLVVAESKDSIEKLYGNSMNLAGDFGFGLNREGELIKLYDRDYKLVHSLQYGSEFPWPDGPDGKGASMELYNGETDNSHNENWHASYIRGGTPGGENSETDPVLGLFINEFMAKNDQGYADESGEYDDWIEVYNANSFDVDLGGLNFRYGISDKQLSMIPFYNQEATTIEANRFKLFWADKEPEQGVLHLDFKLSASGSTIGLAQVIEKEIHMIDQIDYGEQMADVAFGRYPDGNPFLTDLRLSPGNSNLPLSISDHKIVETGFFVYPNPAKNYFYIIHYYLKIPAIVELRNLNGSVVQQAVMTPGENTKMDVSGLPPGMYILQVRAEELMVEKVIIY